MYRSLMVPLDQSAFAEGALPLAFCIARRANAKLELVKVHARYNLDDPHAGWAPFEPMRDAEYQQQEQIYLDATAHWLTAQTPLPMTSSVLAGSAVLPETVADSLLERARTGKADLIVMATHAYGPLGRIGLGSVADELIRRAQMPVLLVRPSEKPSEIIPEPVLDNILIPLDGSPLAEHVLEPALELARLVDGQCCLLRIVEGRSTGKLPEVSQAEEYLEQIASKIREPRLKVQTRVVVARNAAEAILEEAKTQKSNLIALATHARGGLTRLLFGSVADTIVQRSQSPVLVYRPTGKRF